uniref:Uncharacterized protein n=1 Tax=Triticum urartu TaxID=4572 RepID=A0A8R7RHN2_TRIUA
QNLILPTITPHPFILCRRSPRTPCCRSLPICDAAYHSLHSRCDVRGLHSDQSAVDPVSSLPMGSGLHHCPRGNRMSGSTTPRPPIGLHDRASPMLASPQPALHRYGLMLLDPIVPCWTRAPQLHIPSSSSPGADAWGVAVLADVLPVQA